MRKSVRVELESKYWNKIKSMALDHNRTVEEEANVMLENYIRVNKK